MTILIDGKAQAALLRAQVAQQVQQLPHVPTLAVVLVGEDPASAVYVGAKGKACAEAGIVARQITLPAHTTQAELLQHVAALNADAAVAGILVQLPLPAHIDTATVLQTIDPRKDVDGFHPYNAGLLMSGLPALVPCTPLGCMHLLHSVRPNVKGAHAVVVGRSNIVGKPLAMLLLQAGCTITVAHSQTRNLTQICKSADILAVAVGKPHLLGADAVGNNAIVLDVGINRLPATAHKKAALVGDVDTDAVLGIAAAITPVPGGVGPMTVACLLSNTVQAARNLLQSS
jgi:methylenetetrahydrofolate dehydrogenase (NADP+) / methenyltetrahydrofolate cyclohydrolase